LFGYIAPEKSRIGYWLLLISILDESPRWLMSRGRHDKAVRILRKIARVNKRPMPLPCDLHQLTDNDMVGYAVAVSLSTWTFYHSYMHGGPWKTCRFYFKDRPNFGKCGLI